MLENLHVKDLALINEADINFGDGFNILTGETGAGKSIILGSINLALGAKASADVIRTGREYALIELSFSLTDNEIKKVKDMELPIEEDGVILLQRKIMSNKSVSRINGETISLATLKQLREVLLDMYGQHEHQNLLKSSTYVNMLDDYIGDNIYDIKSKLKEDLKNYKELLDEKDNSLGDENIRKRQIELLKFQIDEISDAALIEGEDDELEGRYRFLNNVKKIAVNVEGAHEYLSGDGSSSVDTIGRALDLINSVTTYDENLEPIKDELLNIDNLLSDLNRSLNSYINGLSFDDEEFIKTEERLNLINKLKDKYGSSIDKINDFLSEKTEELEKLTNFEEYLDNLNVEIDKYHQKVIDYCKKIHLLRTEASKNLKDDLVASMKALNFLDVKLDILISEDEDRLSDNGYDEIEFMISLNPGEELRPITHIASGGELSRIMLAFKTVFAAKDDVSTLIFDEIDTGISGVTAYKVAEEMSKLSKNHQIICITHLPQIAAMADQHFLIEKSINEGRTQTNIVGLNYDDSVNELARMLGSDTLSQSAIDNAKELKSKAKEVK